MINYSRENRVERLRKLKVGSLVEIVWDDASGNDDISEEEFDPELQLVRTTSYGMLKYVDNQKIIIIHEHSEGKMNITTIPLYWIVEAKRLYRRSI